MVQRAIDYHIERLNSDRARASAGLAPLVPDKPDWTPPHTLWMRQRKLEAEHRACLPWLFVTAFWLVCIAVVCAHYKGVS